MEFSEGRDQIFTKLLPLVAPVPCLGRILTEDESGAFNAASVWGRISVVAQVRYFNFILAFVLAVIIVGAVGYEPSRVLSVKEGSAAEAGLENGDIITGYDRDIH